MSIHDTCKVRDLTQVQLTSLTAFLSSPSTFPAATRLPLASLDFQAPNPGKPLPTVPKSSKAGSSDPLRNLKIEVELRRELRENIMHQRVIGSYVGRRHAQHLPVRGQNTRTNAQTAKKLNKIDRYA
jgi:small subunit ribosomal protein S13